MKNRILAVDDEPMNLRIIEKILPEEEILLYKAESGKEAINIIQQERIDLVLLDLMLPDVDGYEICRFIKNEAELAGVKVVLVSARAMIDERLRGYEEGADDYITKPFDDRELLAKVKAILRRKDQGHIASKAELKAIRDLSSQIQNPIDSIMGFANLIKNKSYVGYDTTCGKCYQWVGRILECSSELKQAVHKSCKF